MDKKKIDYLIGRFNHEAYQPKSYYDLDLKNRKRLLDDFSAVASVIYDLNKVRLFQKDWIKSKGDIFYKGFEAFWMTQYILSEYFKALGSNRITDTFLNDPQGGKKGSLADMRQKAFGSKNISLLILAKQKIKIDKNIKSQKIIDDYPIAFDSVGVNTQKLLKYRLLYLWMPMQLFLTGLLPHKYWPWKKGRFISMAQLDDMEPYLKVGDILIQRTNFQLTNATLSGFWTHAMLL